jgi:glutathione S-transferase
MRLFHHPFSSNARRAVMTATHLGLPVDLVRVDLGRGEQRQPEFLKKNPNGRVPVLEDGDFVLWESHAIMQYLADKTPGQTVYPEAAQARADLNRWLFWSAQHWTPAVSVLCWEHVVKGFLKQGGPDPEQVKRGEGLVTECAKVLDAHLASTGKPWVAGNRLTLADLALSTPLAVLEPAKLPVRGFEHLLAWFGRVQALDAWKRTEP